MKQKTKVNKKAFEIQFNWLFVLVAGAAILLFFTVVVVKQKNVAETSTQATVLKSIEAIITGASVSTDTTNIIDIPNSDIEVSCGRVSLGKVSKQYQNLILFAPSLIKGDKLITQTLAFSVPYKAVNLLYMTSPKVRYIIITNLNNNLAKEVNKSLPSELRKEFYETNSQIPTIRNENNYKIRFIVFDSDVNAIDLTKFREMPDGDVTALKISGTNVETGQIDFYQKNGQSNIPSWTQKGTSYYITKSSLLGAIYLDDKETYECNMKNVFKRLNLVTQVYNKRRIELYNLPQVSQNCKNIYNDALTNLNKILSSSLNFNQQNINDILSANQQLIAENNKAQIYSCPLIY